ncbi:MAG TPA: winged helix-turn-helix domain-containing protein, partial [Paludibacter sp.]|nr:winged helix-turn-helix domain-containing protein [Paludibacter sp.]
KNVKAVKRVTKLRERELNMALGWLAREGKIILKEVENELFVSLA